ncbi:TOBE domain-containing protein [Bradyrhizobium elkanii]|nr:TOBE domain-containing protein [Bradyrhizobium elkanii]WLB14139.1 TOBE domain-containing protein [Bradyrhizobium elkanii]
MNVKLVEPLGSDTLIHFDLAGVSAIARVDPSLRPKLGDRLSLRPQPGKTHLFDAANGQVLR